MKALTNRVKEVERKPMTWLERIYLWNIFKGNAYHFQSYFLRKKPLLVILKKKAF